jgi:hypothetical protein
MDGSKSAVPLEEESDTVFSIDQCSQLTVAVDLKQD